MPTSNITNPSISSTTVDYVSELGAIGDVDKFISRMEEIALQTQRKPGAADNFGDVEADYSKGFDYFLGKGGVERNLEEAARYLEIAAHVDFPPAQLALGILYLSDNIQNVEYNPVEAFKLLKAAADAEAGAYEPLTVAEFYVGVLYLTASGVNRDPEQAAIYFARAADKDMAEAQYALSHMYERGEGVKPDPKKVIELIIASAKNGSAVAQYELGVMYTLGDVITSDPIKALQNFRLAANQGHANAQYAFAHQYLHAGTIASNEEDGKKALDYFESAADRYAHARHSLALMYLEGIGVESGENSDREAFANFRLAAEEGEKGYAPAQYSLGRMYVEGRGVPRQEYEDRTNRAFGYFKRAADQGFAPAYYDLAMMYLGNHDVTPGEDKEHSGNAFTYMRLAANEGEKGYAPAQYGLGRMYLEGRGVPPQEYEDRENRALDYFTRAAAQNLMPAHLQLGEMYLNSWGVEPSEENEREGANHMLLAAQHELPEAQFKFGFLLETGQGVEQNDIGAYIWYTRASRNGSEDAKRRLKYKKFENTAPLAIEYLENRSKQLEERSTPSTPDVSNDHDLPPTTKEIFALNVESGKTQSEENRTTERFPMRLSLVLLEKIYRAIDSDPEIDHRSAWFSSVLQGYLINNHGHTPLDYPDFKTTKPIQIRISPELNRKIVEAAKAAGLKKTEWVRRVAHGFLDSMQALPHPSPRK